MASTEGRVGFSLHWRHSDWNLFADIEVNIELEERTDHSEINNEAKSATATASTEGRVGYCLPWRHRDWSLFADIEVNIELAGGTEISNEAKSATATAATLIPLLHVQNDEPDTLQPKPDLFRSYSSVEGSQHRTVSFVKQVPCDDDICFLEDVDICLMIPSKLRHLDYPRVEDSHDEDVAKVIRKKFSKLGIDETSKDILAFLSSDHQHSSYVSWQARVEEAAEEEENDAFWQNVSG